MPRLTEITKSVLGQHGVSYGCPRCDSHLKSAIDEIGKPDFCPECSQQFLVPGADEWTSHLVARKESVEQKTAEIEAHKQAKQLKREQAEKERETAKQLAMQSSLPKTPLPVQIREPRLQAQTPQRDSTGTPIIAKVFWIICILFVGVQICGYLASIETGEPNAIQHAALAASTCVWIIAAYVVCRAIDQISR